MYYIYNFVLFCLGYCDVCRVTYFHVNGAIFFRVKYMPDLVLNVHSECRKSHFRGPGF